MKKLLLMLLICFPFAVGASTIRLEWILPTANTDDTPIPDSGPLALDRIAVGWYVCSEGNDLNGQTFTDLPPSQTTVTIEYPDTPETYCFGVYARNANLDCVIQTECRWSGQSNVVRRTITTVPPADGRPRPPTNVIIIVE